MRFPNNKPSQADFKRSVCSYEHAGSFTFCD